MREGAGCARRSLLQEPLRHPFERVQVEGPVLNSSGISVWATDAS